MDHLNFALLEALPIDIFPMRGLEGDNATLYMVIIMYQVTYHMGAQLKKFCMFQPFVAACALQILVKNLYVKQTTVDTNYLKIITKILFSGRTNHFVQMRQHVLMMNKSFNAGDKNKLISPLV